MVRIRPEFLEEFIGGNTHLVEVAAVAELNAARNHVNIQAFHVFVGYVGSGIGDDCKTPVCVVTARLLAAHVVGFLGADVPEFACDVEYALRFVDVNVDLGFAFGPGQHERVPEFRERLP